MPTPSNPGGSNVPPRVRDNDWIVGRLVEHGAAKYHFEEDNSLSYFVRLQTQETEQAARRRSEAEDRARPGIDSQNRPRRPTIDDGGIRTLWGADLKRAIEESKSHVRVGQVVAARLVGREPLAPYTGKAGSRPANPQIPNYRNRWEVETPQFIDERAKTARRILDNPVEARREGNSHPELAATYLVIRGAELLAKHRYPHPDDQKRFVERVREVLVASAERLVQPVPKTTRPADAKREADVPSREPLTRE
jgi:hypothetical protein